MLGVFSADREKKCVRNMVSSSNEAGEKSSAILLLSGRMQYLCGPSDLKCTARSERFRSKGT